MFRRTCRSRGFLTQLQLHWLWRSVSVDLLTKEASADPGTEKTVGFMCRIRKRRRSNEKESARLREEMRDHGEPGKNDDMS